MSIKFTILGCGSSLGIPRIDGYYANCDPKNKKNNRSRCSAIIRSKNLNILRISIETGSGEFFEPARKLFKSCNFQPCAPFAHYKEDINSLYFTKLISND